MEPLKGRDTVQIPITFDTRGNKRAIKAGRPLWLFLIVVFWIFTSISVLIISDTWRGWVYPPASFIALTYIVRFVIFQEVYYKKKRKELKEKNYMFNHNLFWNIYDISTRYPYIVTFGNGMKGVFIAFDKDVIVGKEDHHNYYHHEAIADAYQQLQKRGIETIHIDFMDTVGKDNRMESLFTQAEKTDNPELRRVLMRMYDYVEHRMNKAYASYDVYCFYSYNRAELFWDELQIVLDYFSQANYIRARALGREDISDLVESIVNISEFSVNRANDTMFKEMNKYSEYIRPIWVEEEGERKHINKTLEEIEEAKRVVQAEKRVRRKGRKFNFRKEEEQDINLFSQGYQSTEEDNYSEPQEEQNPYAGFEYMQREEEPQDYSQDSNQSETQDISQMTRKQQKQLLKEQKRQLKQYKKGKKTNKTNNKPSRQAPQPKQKEDSDEEDINLFS